MIAVFAVACGTAIFFGGKKNSISKKAVVVSIAAIVSFFALGLLTDFGTTAEEKMQETRKHTEWIRAILAGEDVELGTHELSEFRYTINRAKKEGLITDEEAARARQTQILLVVRPLKVEETE